MLRAERVLAAVVQTRFTDLRALEEVDSTNRLARAAADDGVGEGLVVVAEHQTAGRGRRGRTWEAPPGSALLMSLLLRPELAAAELHLVTAAVAVAARRACAEVAGVEPDIKWPNDLLVADVKLAGILAEAAAVAGVGPGVTRRPVVVGLGLNVSAHPDGATSLVASGWADPDREALLAAVLTHLDGLLDDWPAVRAGYRAACGTVGRHVRVELAERSFTGEAADVDDEGHLLVVPDGERDTVVVSAADVVHLRPA